MTSKILKTLPKPIQELIEFRLDTLKWLSKLSEHLTHPYHRHHHHDHHYHHHDL